MEVEIDDDTGWVELFLKKKYPKGHDMSITFCKDFICFAVTDGPVTNNVHIDYEEWYNIMKFWEKFKNEMLAR